MVGAAAVLRDGARVLVRLPNWLGDVILCTPALAALRKARPDLELHALVKPGVRAAVDGLPGVSAVRLLEDTSAAGTWHQARALRREGFEAAVLFPKGFREALLARLAGIPVRMGLDTDRRAPLLTDAVPFTGEDWNRHHAEQFAKVLQPLGVHLDDERPSFPIGDEDRAVAERLLAEEGLAPGAFIAFHIGASKAPRAWHPGRFAAAATELHLRTGLRPALLGTAAEAPLHAVFREACPQAADLAGRTSLKGMAAVVARAALFVGNDSGPMHVAGAVGAPVVAVFGPGAPRKTAPYLPPDRLRVVYAGLPCSPCRQAFWRECRPSPEGKPPCLEGVPPWAVVQACLELLGRQVTK